MSYDRERDRPLSDSGLRLLPWESPEGKPCYLSGDDAEPGRIARIADRAEEDQLRFGANALGHAERVLGIPTAGPLTLRVALQRTAASLEDTLRVADSRGARLIEGWNNE
ncbi:hypothetical protein [Streptomyces mayteni]